MQFSWHDATDGRHLWCDGRNVGTLLPFSQERISARDQLDEVRPGVFRWRRRFRLARPLTAYGVRLTLDFAAGHRARYAMIPGVSYQGNAWGTGGEPKGFTAESEPWSFAYHRTALAGATYSEGEAFAVALFGQLSESDGPFSCSLLPEGDRTTHRLIWPEEERPRVYCSRDQYGPPYQGELVLGADGTFAATAYLVIAPVGAPRTGWRSFLDFAWELNKHTVTTWFPPRQVWDLGVAFTRESLWAEEGAFRGFHNGLVWQDGGWIQRPRGKYEIGWVGQNASRANSLLADFLRRGERESLDKGLAALDCWAEYARLPNGLFRCHFDDILGLAQEPEVQDACNLGDAAENYFEAHDLAARCGVQRPHYRALAFGLCDFALAAQSPEGRFGKAWDNEEHCLDPNGTIGAFLVPALLEAYRVSRHREYLTAATRGYEFYINELIRDGYATAGALDTHCVDKESASPLLGAAITLYDLTGEDRYLAWAERASYYLSTWQWHYSVPFPTGSALEAMGYDTFGGTSVSTQHHHLDAYAIAFVGPWLRLAELIDQPIWRERALAAWANGTIGISDGTLEVMGRRRPAGSQDEAFCQTRWWDRASVSQWLVSWPTAFRLELLRKLPDWTVLREASS